MLIKVCSKLIHPQELVYASKSNSKKYYVVITETVLSDDFCTCPGWRFREHCSHIEDARQNFCCNWYVKLEDAKDLDQCPQCGGSIEEFETDPEWN